VQIRALYLLAINCMFYPVDLGTIPRAAVNLESGHLVFRRGKNSQPRVGFLLPETINAIKAWLALRTDASPLLFVNTAGSAWTRKTLHSNLAKHKRAAKLPKDLTWKAFRKGAYTAALADPSVDIFTAKILAGHATGITDDYVEANPERCRKAVEAISRHYFAQSISSAA
jgi:integrase